MTFQNTKKILSQQKKNIKHLCKVLNEKCILLTVVHVY